MKRMTTQVHGSGLSLGVFKVGKFMCFPTSSRGGGGDPFEDYFSLETVCMIAI